MGSFASKLGRLAKKMMMKQDESGSSEPIPQWEKDGFPDYGSWHELKLLKNASPETKASYKALRQSARKRRLAGKAVPGSQSRPESSPASPSRPMRTPELDPSDVGDVGTIGIFNRKGRKK